MSPIKQVKRSAKISTLFIKGNTLATFSGYFTFRTHKMTMDWFNWIMPTVVTEKFRRFFFYKFLINWIINIAHDCYYTYITPKNSFVFNCLAA